jgi:hypothetical protein
MVPEFFSTSLACWPARLALARYWEPPYEPVINKIYG